MAVTLPQKLYGLRGLQADRIACETEDLVRVQRSRNSSCGPVIHIRAHIPMPITLQAQTACRAQLNWRCIKSAVLGPYPEYAFRVDIEATVTLRV